jgi:O-antigen ligase
LLFLALVQVLFSDMLGPSAGGYAGQRFFLAIILGVLISAFSLDQGRYSPVSFSDLVRLLSPSLALSFAFLLLSLSFRGQSYAWIEPGMYSLFFFAAVAGGAGLAWSRSGAGYVRVLILFVTAACALYGLASINVYLFATLDGITGLIDFIPWGFVNIRYWSHIATWCLPLIPLAVLVGPLKKVRIWRIIVMLGAGMWWWILFLTMGRGSILGIAFGVVFVTLLFGRRVFPWLKVFLQYLLAGIVIWLLLSVVIPSFMESGIQVRTIKADSSGRIPLFIEAWKMSLQNFPFGMGPQSWLTHEPITEAYATGKKFGHPHNMYLMWAAEYGWLLIAAMGLVVIQAIRNFWRRRAELLDSDDSNQLLLLAGFTASVSAALFHAGVSAVFMAPGSMLVGLFVLIGFWALILPGGDFSKVERPLLNPGRRVLIGGLVSMVFLIFWALWMGEVWRYYQDMRADEPYYLEHESEGTLPRFWFHGNFPRN